jgi:hypothetical protein
MYKETFEMNREVPPEWRATNPFPFSSITSNIFTMSIHRHHIFKSPKIGRSAKFPTFFSSTALHKDKIVRAALQM